MTENDKNISLLNEATSSDEVDQLLNLAEKVDWRIREIEKDLSRSRAQMFVVTIVFYAIIIGGTLSYKNWMGHPDAKWAMPLGAAISIITIFVFLFNRLQIRKLLRDELRTELRVSGDLIQMLSSLVESLPSTTGVVNRAMFLIRLKRLRFSDQRIDAGSSKALFDMFSDKI